MANEETCLISISYATLGEIRGCVVCTDAAADGGGMSQKEFDEIDELRRLAESVSEPDFEYFSTT